MIRQKVRSNIAYLVALVATLSLSTACGGATDPDSTEWENESSEASDDSSDDTSSSDDEFAAVDDSSSVTVADEDESSSSEDTADPTAFLNDSDTRAMWLWSESPGVGQILNNEGGAQDDLFSFLEAPHGKSSRSINRLFFESRGYSNVDRFSKVREATYDPITDQDQDKLRDFIKRAKSNDIEVEYLDGQAIWVASDANAEAPKQICRDIVAFNKGTDDPMERFDGIHLDIEPHTVRDGPYAGVWWENRLDGGYNAEWTKRWKDILNSCRDIVDDYQAETGHQLTLASDLGTDYAHYNKPILEFLNRSGGPLDYLTIMNYFDDRSNKDGDPAYFYGMAEEGAGEPVGGVVENMASWDEIPLMFAVETGPESIAVDWQSFYQEGYEAMYGTIDTMLDEYSNANMIGVGIHHYGPNSYRGMKK